MWRFYNGFIPVSYAVSYRFHTGFIHLVCSVHTSWLLNVILIMLTHSGSARGAASNKCNDVVFLVSYRFHISFIHLILISAQFVSLERDLDHPHAQRQRS